MKQVLAGLIVFIGVIGFAFIISTIVALPVMLLWNWLCPSIFGLPVISFWQSCGLLLLFYILVKSSMASSS